MVNAIKELQHPQSGTTIAEGIAVKRARRSASTRDIIRQQVDGLTVDEGDIERTIVMLLEIERP